MKNQPTSPNNNNLVLRYAGLTAQILIGLSLALYVGLKLDKKLSFSTPILVWVLPLIVIIVMIYKVIKDTSKK